MFTVYDQHAFFFFTGYKDYFVPAAHSSQHKYRVSVSQLSDWSLNSQLCYLHKTPRSNTKLSAGSLMDREEARREGWSGVQEAVNKYHTWSWIMTHGCLHIDDKREAWNWQIRWSGTIKRGHLSLVTTEPLALYRSHDWLVILNLLLNTV